MGNVTCIFEANDQGNPQAAEDLLPHVCDKVRRLAARKLSQEKPGQTLQATALVHAAYIVQDTFARTFQRLDRIQWQGKKAFARWLCGTAMNVLRESEVA